jgi:hypothetical protein
MALHGFQIPGWGPTTPLAVVALTIVAVLVWQLSHVGMRPAKLPPGPPTLPVIGNLHLMPKSHAWLQYSKWAKQYG